MSIAYRANGPSFTPRRGARCGEDALAQAAHVRDPRQRVDVGEVAVVAGEPSCSLLGDDQRRRDHRERAGGDEGVRHMRGSRDRKLSRRTPATPRRARRGAPAATCTGSTASGLSAGVSAQMRDFAVRDQHGRHEDRESGYQPRVCRHLEHAAGVMQMPSGEERRARRSRSRCSRGRRRRRKRVGIDRVERGDEQPANDVEHRRGVPGRLGGEPHLGELGREIGRAVVGALRSPGVARTPRAGRTVGRRVQA